MRYENGEEVDTNSRIGGWRRSRPTVALPTGKRIEPKTETMPDGTVITYWRKIKMLATSYTAASAGGQPHTHRRRRAAGRRGRRPAPDSAAFAGLRARLWHGRCAGHGRRYHLTAYRPCATRMATTFRGAGGSTSICCGRRPPSVTSPGWCLTIHRCRNRTTDSNDPNRQSRQLSQARSFSPAADRSARRVRAACLERQLRSRHRQPPRRAQHRLLLRDDHYAAGQLGRILGSAAQPHEPAVGPASSSARAASPTAICRSTWVWSWATSFMPWRPLPARSASRLRRSSSMAARRQRVRRHRRGRAA